MNSSIMNTYARLPVHFVSGKGAWLTDAEGKKYLDALSGIAVCSLGHAHPAVTKAVCEQAGTLVHTSNLYGIGNQDVLADRLTGLSGMERVFFSNSGAEANEAAIKIARLYGHNKGIDKPTVIVAENSFHGRTLATLTATGNRKVQAGFEPLVQGFVRVPFNDLDAIRTVAQNNQDVVAVLVEPVQGESGIRIPDEDYLSGIRAICDENGWLMMLDEIQTGIGRSGEWFAFQHEGAKPDVMTLAKALGNGVPIGACLAAGPATDVLQPGNHGSTFGGNPLACAAALSVLDVMTSEDLCARAVILGDRMQAGFDAALADVEGVIEIRHKGLLIGIELAEECAPLVKQALDEGLLINVAGGNVVRLLPPLTLTDDEADQIVARVSALIKAFTAA